MNPSFTYPEAKAAMAAAGFAVSPGTAWTAQDGVTYQLFAASAVYGKEPSYSKYKANYAFAYPVAPASLAAAVVDGSYAATLAGTPTSGAHPLTVTLTVTETGGAGSSFLWDFNDGNTTTTTVNHTTHAYAAAGTFHPKVTPTVAGVVTPQVTGNAITVT